ncbi:MAG: hypothetical protein COB76_04320 [Alphaproteobacteria bacterium]|nr:MAG: hypothetical protein COB76_04320 [Alphaproteobacteria bacterium]
MPRVCLGAFLFPFIFKEFLTMAKRNDLFAVFQNEIGNNLTNDTDDILNAKHKFKELGYYKDPIISGYIDKPLVDSVRGYQRDKGLKIDGKINPGGETEATIFGDFLSLPKPTIKDDNYDFKIKNPRMIPSLFSHANAASGLSRAVPWVIENWPTVTRGAGAAKKVWDVWRSAPVNARQDEVDQMCDEQYERDVQTCRDLANSGQKQRSAVCYESASRRMAQCRKDGSDQDLPPLTK